MDSRSLGLLADAAATLARLDERLSSASACLTEGWVARALIGEAVASARALSSCSDEIGSSRRDWNVLTLTLPVGRTSPPAKPQRPGRGLAGTRRRSCNAGAGGSAGGWAPGRRGSAGPDRVI